MKPLHADLTWRIKGHVRESMQVDKLVDYIVRRLPRPVGNHLFEVELAFQIKIKRHVIYVTRRDAR